MAVELNSSHVVGIGSSKKKQEQRVIGISGSGFFLFRHDLGFFFSFITKQASVCMYVWNQKFYGKSV